MKSDVIRKRSHHDGRQLAAGETPTARPRVSHRPSRAREASPTLAPDSTTQLSYTYHDDPEYRPSYSELMGAVGSESNNHGFNSQGVYSATTFPGPYHPDHMTQLYNHHPADALPFASVDLPEIETSGRTNKRPRTSTDSASELPSSAVSFSSFNDGYSSPSSSTSHSHRSSMEFPFSRFPRYNILRGAGTNAFWHPPMLSRDRSPQFVHPPMLPVTDEAPMDYLHPHPPSEEDSLFSACLHPPMLPRMTTGIRNTPTRGCTPIRPIIMTPTCIRSESRHRPPACLGNQTRRGSTELRVEM